MSEESRSIPRFLITGDELTGVPTMLRLKDLDNEDFRPMGRVLSVLSLRKLCSIYDS